MAGIVRDFTVVPDYAHSRVLSVYAVKCAFTFPAESGLRLPTSKE